MPLPPYDVVDDGGAAGGRRHLLAHFAEAGDYRYMCIHGSEMIGVVTVVGP